MALPDDLGYVWTGDRGAGADLDKSERYPTLVVPRLPQIGR